MEEKTPEEIMAECLLKGGKMLAKACSKCGAPLFEYRGETMCVVCNTPDASNVAHQMQIGTTHEERGMERASSKRAGHFGERIAEELTVTLIALCRRVREEEDPVGCRELMNCISNGVDALRRLSDQ